MSHQPSFVSIVWVVFWLGLVWVFLSKQLVLWASSEWRLSLNNYYVKLRCSNKYHVHFRSALQLTSHNAQVITHCDFFKWESELYRMQATNTKEKQHYLWFCPLLPRKPQPSPYYAQSVSISKKCNFNMLRILGTPTICRHVRASDYKGSLYAKLKRTE